MTKMRTQRQVGWVGRGRKMIFLEAKAPLVPALSMGLSVCPYHPVGHLVSPLCFLLHPFIALARKIASLLLWTMIVLIFHFIGFSGQKGNQIFCKEKSQYFKYKFGILSNLLHF